jgi:hypothetical protein
MKFHSVAPGATVQFACRTSFLRRVVSHIIRMAGRRPTA